jgi:hypothetical protein
MLPTLAATQKRAAEHSVDFLTPQKFTRCAHLLYAFRRKTNVGAPDINPMLAGISVSK